MATSKVALYILYGVPCSGKSTTAVHTAYHQNIRTVVSTDYLREAQRLYVPQEQAPTLAKVTHTAWELYGPPTRPNIETGFIDHANEVARATKFIVKRIVGDGFDAVIEGVHFHSGIIEELRASNRDAEILPALLVVRTTDELLQRVTRKEEQRAQGAAPTFWREHVPIMLAIQDFLIADALAHGIHITTADDWRLNGPSKPNTS